MFSGLPLCSFSLWERSFEFHLLFVPQVYQSECCRNTRLKKLYQKSRDSTENGYGVISSIDPWNSIYNFSLLQLIEYTYPCTRVNVDIPNDSSPEVVQLE